MRFLRALPVCLALTLALCAGRFAGAAEGAAKPEDFVAGYAAFLSGDYARAQALWRNLAERGDIDAAFNLATLYDNGYGLVADPDSAMAWYRRAADKKFGPAEVALSRLTRAKAAATPGDPNADAALRQLKTAAERGSAEAQFILAVAYDRGLGVIPNYSTAVSWYQRAAEQGLAEAQYNLATLYDQGLGVQNDPALALHWYRKAAEAGSPLAANNLGYLHEYGLGVPQSDEEALAWYRKAAQAGLDTAQTNLAVLYQLGRGTARDYGEAARWFRAAAEQGDAEATLNLGVLYANGLGVEKDHVEALSWLAQARGSADAAVALRAAKLYESLAAALDASQVEAAATRAAGLVPRPTPVTLSTRGDGRPQPRSLGAFGDGALAAQRYLALLGFYDGPVDGAGGPKTRASVLAFWRARDPRAKSGEVTPELLATLIAAFSAKGSTPAAP